MQDWFKRDEDDCNAYFFMTDEELEEIMQMPENITDAPEDPAMTEEEERMHLRMIDEHLAELDRREREGYPDDEDI